jgi:hypothetical protein
VRIPTLVVRPRRFNARIAGKSRLKPFIRPVYWELLSRPRPVVSQSLIRASVCRRYLSG